MTAKRRGHKEALARLFEVAEAQHGYFTTKQAEAAGFSGKNHGYHVSSGNWVREGRGIYRLSRFPLAERPDLMRWYLWSRGRDEAPRGVYSHETALSLHELSDVNPARLHMTVPASFRRSARAGKGLVLHRGELHADEVEVRHGVKLTTPLKAIVDVMAERSIDLDHIRQAVREAFQRGLVSAYHLARATRVPAAVKREIERLRKAR